MFHPRKMLHSPALQVRLAARNSTLTSPTCGLAPGHLQANLVVLPSAYAHDFELLCARNPVPCPLLAKSASVGNSTNFVSLIPGVSDKQIAVEFDVRTDLPKYNVYIDGELVEEGISDVLDHWSEQDHVAFLVGCSYSFEAALSRAGLTPPHILHKRNVAMFRTSIPLCPAGAFQGGTYVVSLRMYEQEDVEKVRDVTRAYVATHGEPIAWGWEGIRKIGLADVRTPDWGDAPMTAEGQAVGVEYVGKERGAVPVVWGCGVTPQEVVMRAKIPGVVLGHMPGHMAVLDVMEDNVLKRV